MADFFPITITINHNIPALDRLVSWLETNNETADKSCGCACSTTPATVCEEPVKADSAEENKPEVAVYVEPTYKVDVKTEVTPVEEAVTECVNYTYEQLAECAMGLRDADPNNMAKIRALFPEFGIRTLNALKNDQDGINRFAAKLIEIGGAM